MQVGNWYSREGTREPCQLVAVESLWGQEVCVVVSPGRGDVERVPVDALTSLTSLSEGRSADHLSYASAAARIADALQQQALAAPLEASVVPLPHQIHALQRAMTTDRVRYLLADEVGLGKTIEAGLILRELKVRGMVRRVLVVAPAGLVSQWIGEMRSHFAESFRPVSPSHFAAWRTLMGDDESTNLWQIHDQVVCSVDSVKPLHGRQGWSRDQVARYNRERFEDIVSAGWDLIIVDEAHHLAGSTPRVARYELGEGLAAAAPHLLLLTATPHQGKTDAFRRLIGLLDPHALPDDESVRRENVAPYVIRTEKRQAIDANGDLLFLPRNTQVIAVSWDRARDEQRALYDAVTEYVRTGYNQALREKRTAIGFLMILMQRLVTSSTAAIRAALERRLTTLDIPSEQLTIFAEDIGEDWMEMDGHEQMESLLNTRLGGLRNERGEVELLLSAARRCEAQGPDAKAEALLDCMRRLQREENDPQLKALVFTEFVATQSMLEEYLTARGYSVICLNGGMDVEERLRVQQAFADDQQVLVSTEAGGEGINLQFCHVVINYDLPWNPMRIEQRIGRVDRIGQRSVVQAINLALEDTVEQRVREVLEEKLSRILTEFGVDKLADVLDSETSGAIFTEAFIGAVRDPTRAAERAEQLADEIVRRAEDARVGADVLQSTTGLVPHDAREVLDHQMPFWTERMTLSHLRSQSGQGAGVDHDDVGYRLRWPSGREQRHVTFARDDASAATASLLTLEDTDVRALMAPLPRVVPGQPIPTVEVYGVSEHVSGVWSLWLISLYAGESPRQRLLPLFISDNGQVFASTARVVWDRLIDPEGTVRLLNQTVDLAKASGLYASSHRRAQQEGEPIYRALLEEHHDRRSHQLRVRETAFDARARSIERVGLPQVRSFRQRELDLERTAWQKEMEIQANALPELSAVVMVRVARSEAGK